MKKIIKIIYCLIFFGICLFNLVASPFLKSNEMIEKKALAEMPEFIEDGKINSNFSDEFDTYLNDNFSFRSQLLTASDFIKSKILKSPVSNVITGKKGWLFYENTKDDYLGVNQLTDEECDRITVTLSLIQENVESRGGKFVFAPAPNKNSVYSEYMPSSYIKTDESSLQKLCKALDAAKVNYADLLSDLKSAKSGGTVLYHKRDTHWNYLGAKTGYASIMNAMGREATAYKDAEYTCRTDWSGDLDKMLYPSGGFADDQYYYDIDTSGFRFTYLHSVDKTEDMLYNFMSDKEENDRLITSMNMKDRSGTAIYMVRDSFGRALLPYMISSYSTATFARTDCPDINSMKDGTDFVYEIAERNLRNIIETAPFMYAPVRDVKYSDTFKSDNNIAVTSVEGYGVRIYGTIDEKMCSDDGRVYVLLEGSDGSVTYEAFPIKESAMLEEGNVTADSSAGFSLILDKSALEAGGYSVRVISGNYCSEKLADFTITK